MFIIEHFYINKIRLHFGSNLQNVIVYGFWHAADTSALKKPGFERRLYLTLYLPMSSFQIS